MCKALPATAFTESPPAIRSSAHKKCLAPQLAWTGEDGGSYTAMQGLLESQLGPPLLGIAGVASIWGDEEGKIASPLEQLEEHFCIYRRRAILASPYWEIEDSSTSSGVAAFPILRARKSRTCSEDLDLYLARSTNGRPMTNRDWARSGALAPEVIKQLSSFARKTDQQLVCVDSTVAGDRRTLRRADPRP